MSTELETIPPSEDQQDWIRGVAAGLSRAFPIVERQDIQQQLWVFWYEQWDVIAKMLAHPEKSRQLVQTCLRRWGYSWAKQETATYRGWYVEDMQEYPPKMVADLLPFIFDSEAWSNLSSTASHGAQLKNATGDALAVYADLTAAWKRIGSGDRGVLTQGYVMGVEVAQLAQDWQVGEDTARKRVERALERLAVEMNGIARMDGLRVDSCNRKAMSNAQVRAQMADSW